ncbi:MAG: uroporphyrinogen-III C-methyltransferase [Verrucomicrobia bacterium]|nr:uroporphyrinogen-III C-methyltransferase [Verrucomicrobiota bacterium]
MSSSGKVYLVGAGPGDPELITMKGHRLLRTCDAVVYDYLVSTAMLEWLRPDCERHYVGKRAGLHALPQEEIEDLLVRLAREGKQVVRLKGGDPFIFGRGGEEALTLRKHGIAYEVVPAVTAALGCAAYVGVPLTHRKFSSSVTFISGHEQPGKEAVLEIDWGSHAQSGSTLVLYMAMGRLEEICQQLTARGMSPTTPVCVVEWGTTPRQRSVSGQLQDIVWRVQEAGVGAPAVVIIGAVAALGDSLSWFDPVI